MVPYAWLAGREYRRTSSLCDRIERMGEQEIQSLQETMLGRMLDFATREVPFYMSYRKPVETLRPSEALRAFPVISKKIVQEHYKEFEPRCLTSISYHQASTGGSTGSQLTFNEDDGTYGREMAFIHSQWARVGYRPWHRKATFRGVPFPGLPSGIFWQSNPIHNELQFSPFHMSEENMPRYLQRLQGYRPEFLHGYPSAISVLAEYILRHARGMALPSLKAALLASEHCAPEMRARIEKAFGVPAYTFYGHSERVILAGECEHSAIYHCFPGYGHVELLLPNGESCKDGDVGELVGTGFCNYSMPLIRYATDDYATMHEGPCPDCGRPWLRFSDVLGRWNDEGTLLTQSGSRVSAAAINMHGTMFDRVVRYQYVQEARGEVIIRVLPAPGYDVADTQAILQAHWNKLGSEMVFSVDVVEGIPLTSTGKQRRIVCEIP